MNFKLSYLQLENGSVFPGFSPVYQTGNFYGEVVFNTGMTGYVESLTDPSYAGQLLVFTYPLIGNYGVPKESRWESRRVHPRGVIVSEACINYSHSDATQSLLSWLRGQKVPIIMGVDTRELTKTIRSHGVLLGAITDKKVSIKKFTDPNKENLVGQVSLEKKKIYGRGRKKIIAVDCGMKENIIRSLQEFPVTIERVPYDYDYSGERYDGLFISNGPGDPAAVTPTIAILKKALQKKTPIFGICLGAQLLAIASGAKTFKLPFGHRGHNQPCLEVETGRCFITSQNHGYAVDEKTIQKDWYVNFRNLNDNSVEGIAHKTLPYFSVQFHPEAAPGPTDTRWMFEKFINSL